jgi:hypothetical protein
MAESKNNPANGKVDFPKGYRPMTSATLRLQVPERDGFHRHWFRGTPERIARAQQAGYQFVQPEELEEGSINNFDLGGDSDQTGNTDLGTRVSIISGGELDNTGQPGRMYLMECPMEYFDYAQSIVNASTDDVATALRGGTIGEGRNGEKSADGNKRYVGFEQPGSSLKGKVPDLFVPKRRT